MPATYVGASSAPSCGLPCQSKSWPFLTLFHHACCMCTCLLPALMTVHTVHLAFFALQILPFFHLAYTSAVINHASLLEAPFAHACLNHLSACACRLLPQFACCSVLNVLRSGWAPRGGGDEWVGKAHSILLPSQISVLE